MSNGLRSTLLSGVLDINSTIIFFYLSLIHANPNEEFFTYLNKVQSFVPLKKAKLITALHNFKVLFLFNSTVLLNAILFITLIYQLFAFVARNVSKETKRTKIISDYLSFIYSVRFYRLLFSFVTTYLATIFLYWIPLSEASYTDMVYSERFALFLLGLSLVLYYLVLGYSKAHLGIAFEFLFPVSYFIIFGSFMSPDNVMFPIKWYNVVFKAFMFLFCLTVIYCKLTSPSMYDCLQNYNMISSEVNKKHSKAFLYKTFNLLDVEQGKAQELEETPRLQIKSGSDLINDNQRKNINLGNHVAFISPASKVSADEKCFIVEPSISLQETIDRDIKPVSLDDFLSLKLYDDAENEYITFLFEKEDKTPKKSEKLAADKTKKVILENNTLRNWPPIPESSPKNIEIEENIDKLVEVREKPIKPSRIPIRIKRSSNTDSSLISKMKAKKAARNAFYDKHLDKRLYDLKEEPTSADGKCMEVKPSKIPKLINSYKKNFVKSPHSSSFNSSKIKNLDYHRALKHTSEQ